MTTTEAIAVHFEGTVTRVDDHGIEIANAEHETFFLPYTQAMVRFTVGQLLDVHGHRSSGEVTIDSVE